MFGDVDLAKARDKLLAALKRQGITDERVLAAMAAVPREEFVRPRDRAMAYDNAPLPIGAGQTVSQPYIVALMTSALELAGTEKVLEIGTGSGYQTAILARLAREVFSIERFAELAERALSVLERIGVANVHIQVGDGTQGWPEEAPFDRILVTAAAPRIPEPLVAQLAENGLLVIPVGDENAQSLLAYRKRNGVLQRRHLCECRFVPLVGQEGWPSS